MKSITTSLPKMVNTMKPQWFRTATIVFGLISALALFIALRQSDWERDAALTASITWLTALWWVLEPVPIPVTSLLPIALLPLTGVLEASQVAEAYGSPLILLLLGGFILSQALEKNHAHTRIAFYILRLIGQDSERKLILGFMVAAAALSMWISNTATTLMLLPVAVAMIAQARDKTFAVPLLLATAYGASIGGMGTPIGTPPNLVFMQVYQDTVGAEVPFARWMACALPVVIVFIPLAWWWLTRSLRGRATSFQLRELGPVSSAEKRVLLVFLLIIFAWVFRSEPFGGWKTWLGLPKANDASVALLGVILLFLTPAGKQQGQLLDWEAATRIPWGILLLFAGGITIAKAFTVSGLGLILSESLAGLLPASKLLALIMLCLFVTFLTEITSNTATTTLLMPILAVVAMELGLPPALIMIPAALSASCAFMLPVATAPNAIVFGRSHVTIKQMVRAGFALNLIGVGVIATLSYALVPRLILGN